MSDVFTNTYFADQLRISRKRGLVLLSLLATNVLVFLLAWLAGLGVRPTQPREEAAHWSASSGVDHQATNSMADVLRPAAAPSEPTEITLQESASEVAAESPAELPPQPSAEGLAEIRETTKQKDMADASRWTPWKDCLEQLQDCLSAFNSNLPGVDLQRPIVVVDRVVILNPPANRGEVNFLIDGLPRNLQPGEMLEIAGSDMWRIEFHRGGEFGDCELTIAPGRHAFAVGGEGWMLLPQGN